MGSLLIGVLSRVTCKYIKVGNENGEDKIRFQDGPEQGWVWQVPHQFKPNYYYFKFFFITSLYIFTHILLQTPNFVLFIDVSKFLLIY